MGILYMLEIYIYPKIVHMRKLYSGLYVVLYVSFICTNITLDIEQYMSYIALLYG